MWDFPPEDIITLHFRQFTLFFVCAGAEGMTDEPLIFSNDGELSCKLKYGIYMLYFLFEVHLFISSTYY